MKFSKSPQHIALGRSLVVFALAALAVGTAHAQQQGITDTEILLGEVLPFTGPPALVGTGYSIGARTAVAEVNAAGGINGRKVRLISEDDGYTPSRTIQAVRKLITSDKVFGLVATSGASQGVAALPLIEQSGVLTISAAGYAKQLFTPVKKNVFVMGQTYDVLIYELVKHMNVKHPGKKWGIVSQDDESGELVREGFDRAAKDFKLEVVSKQIYSRGQQDFSSEMARFTRSGGEVLIAGGILNENVVMVKELERLGAKVPTGIFFIGRFPTTLQLMGPAGDGIYVSDYVEPEDGPKGIAFLQRVLKFTSADDVKKVNRFTPIGYAATNTMLEAIRRCGKVVTWACATDELEKMKNFETGVMGSVSYSRESHFSSMKPIVMRGSHATQTYKPVD